MNLRLGGLAAAWPFGLLAFVLPLLLYGLTMPVDVVFEDDGLFLLNGVFLGVEHRLATRSSRWYITCSSSSHWGRRPSRDTCCLRCSHLAPAFSFSWWSSSCV